MVLVSVASFILVAWMVYRTTKIQFAKLYARKVSISNEGNLRVVTWNYGKGMTEIVKIHTSISLDNRDAVVRAVRMWGIVRRKSIIEVAVAAPKGEIFFRTY
jgi:hypothetical protein